MTFDTNTTIFLFHPSSDSVWIGISEKFERVEHMQNHRGAAGRKLATLALLSTLIILTGATVLAKSEQYLVKLLGTRPGWPDNMTAAEEKVMTDHFHYLKDLVKQKKVLMAGPVFDFKFGLIVLNVNDRDEAEAIMKDEPSVLAGVHTYEMSPMVASLLVDYQSPERYVTEPTERVLYKEIEVAASLDDVWRAWTTTEGIKSFFSPNADIELRPGGKFEVYFSMNAPEGMRGSEGCRVLSYLDKQMLSFEWNAPPQFDSLRYVYTRIIIFFDQLSDGKTKVRFSHVGWGEGEKWGEIHDYFDSAWGRVLENFAKSITNNNK